MVPFRTLASKFHGCSHFDSNNNLGCGNNLLTIALLTNAVIKIAGKLGSQSLLITPDTHVSRGRSLQTNERFGAFAQGFLCKAD